MQSKKEKKVLISVLISKFFYAKTVQNAKKCSDIYIEKRKISNK